MDADWWIGTDREGRRWLVKMTGSSYAYREHVFALLAQRLGISCQSSTYLLVRSENAEPRLCTRCSEPYQLALWSMDEHSSQPCSWTCPLADIRGKGIDFATIKRLSVSGLASFEDLVRGDVLGYLCGQFEPHGHFFLQNHEYVVIDNECMFAGSPCLHSCHWHECYNARTLLIDVCRGSVRMEMKKITILPSCRKATRS